MRKNHEEELVGDASHHHMRSLSFDGGGAMMQGAMMGSGMEY
jgi:hypothetical protein